MVFLQPFAPKSIDVGSGGELGARAPPRFCSKQRSALFVFKKFPLLLKKKMPSKRRASPSLRCFLHPCLKEFTIFEFGKNFN